MYLKLIRRLYNLRCPDCDIVQPVFNLSSTWRPTWGTVQLNSDVACVSCSKRLRLQPTYGRAGMTVLSIVVGVISAIVFFILFFPVMSFSIQLLGLWGLLALPLFLLLWYGLSALMFGLVGPHFRKVILA